MVLSILKITLCFLRAHINIIGKTCVRKQKIRHTLCKVLDFSVIILQFICLSGIIFDLKCSFPEHSSIFRTSNARFIDMADHSVAVHLLRGQRPLFLWQGGLEETLSRSGNERKRIKYDFIHHTHT